MVILPTVDPTGVMARVLSNQVVQTPVWGSVVRVFKRPTDRHVLEVRVPPMNPSDAADLVGSLLEANATDKLVRFTWHQLERGLPSLSGAKVAGASQAGRVLDIDGITGGTTIEKARAFSVIVDNVSYLYIATTAAPVSTGAASVILDTKIRVSPDDNADVELNAPVVEGYLGGDSASWETDGAIVRGLDFTVTERR